jgi:hypothetical protein
MSAGPIVPLFGLIEGRFQALVNPLADLDLSFEDDDQLD